MRFCLCLCLALLLAGCGHRHPPDKEIERAMKRCEDFGYLRGDSGHASCVQKLDAKAEAGREKRLARELAR